MKAGRAFGCLFWALLYCVLYLDLVGGSSNSDEELLDFDFAAAKDPAAAAAEDWQLDDDLDEQQQADHKLESNMLDFSVDLDEPEPERQVPQFDYREKALRNALAKALGDEGLRQKFIEVMPILRVLSSQQRVALSALISAQMNAKQGHELRLEQVRMMFGNDKKLLLPIVYDLANLVKSSTRKYLNLGSDLATAALLHTPPPNRRQDQLTVAETEQDDRVGTIDVSGKTEDVTDSGSGKPEDDTSLEDFFEEMQSDVLDPQMINEALQSADLQKNSSSNENAKRVRRSANEFVHKLTRSVPVSVTEQQLLGGIAGRTVRLNTTSFQQPTSSSSSSNQSYVEIENLAFAGLNGTEVIPLGADERLDLQRNSDEEALQEEPLPSPEELIAGPRYRLGKRPPSSGQKSAPVKRKRLQTASRGRPKSSASSHKPQVVVGPLRKCERFTSNMCIRTDDYPLEQIMGSIRRHKNAMSALLAEFYDKPNNNLEFGDDFDDFSLNKKRREDEGSSAGGMCLSVVRYARPQKAKSASGEWKYIVNTGQHTQTLRLEKCSNPGESCSYLAQTYRSHCSQVYNYHRLLSWDKVRGLHVDIFKVPTCCSCQVDGYRQQFPPLSSIQAKDYSPLANFKPESVASNGYSTINEEDLDYAEDSEEDELGLGLRYPTFNGRDTNELYAGGSKKLRGASTSVGPYLSPPDDDVEEEQQQQRFSGYKSHSHKSPGASSKKYYSQVSHRRPHQHQQQQQQLNEARVDLDLAPSEMHTDQEVNVNLFAGPEKPIQRLPINRKRIYTSTHPNTAAAAAAAATSAVSSSSPSSSAGGVRLRVPQTTSLPARTGTAAGISFHSSGHATHAHQAAAAAAAAGAAPFPVASPTAATSQPALIQRNQQHIGSGSVSGSGSKSRPRFYAPPSTTPLAVAPIPISVAASPASPLPTERTTQQQQQQPGGQQQQQQYKSTALPQPPAGVYHVNSNSIYTSSSSTGSSSGSNSVDGASAGPSNGTKRINYNYHPIIDFFEKSSSRRAEQATAAPAPASVSGGFTDYDMEESRLMEQRVYPQRPASMGMGMATGVFQHPIPIPTTSNERRMGFGAGGAGGMGGLGGLGGGRQGFANDNAWQPMVVAP